ncbi:hypothetical protein [Brachyspira hyodysenteriae]|uniref:hypothetical protein n=1 Tax=Brachyspira hyodysenteriae TaxID=159 RepID=UPI00063DAD3C|nr:hypothetical protein [Brachyspira hyodysenteriae]KLI52950.1 hypothetical protein SZ42_03545 [Brachyspira hyodysenteriae]
MKRSYLLFLMIVSVFIMSCGGHFFNPRYYYNRSSSSSSSGSAPDTGPEKLPDEVPADEDPFKLPEDYNDPNYQFPADKFKNWLFKASFQGDKLPIYNFFNDNSRSWIPGGADWNNITAEYYNGKDGENYVVSGILTVSITSLKVYKYPGNNPLYSSLGYLPGRMDRFNFYSINGEASVAPLKQYLIAVDTYSKFIFAFGAITGTKNVMGQDVPVSFEAVEKHGDKKAFYEYDPIGYVTENGSVILYEHYKTEFVDAPTSYMPKDHNFDKMAQPTPTGQGYSPYRPLNASSTEPAPEEDQKTFKDNINTIKSKYSEFKYRDYSGYMLDGKNQIDLNLWKAGNYGGRSFALYSYTFESGTGTDSSVPNMKVVTDYYNNSKPQETKTYKVKTITSKYKAIYENTANPSDTIIVSLVKVNNKDTISFDGTSLDPDFKDYGPIFTDRVLNARFEGTGDSSTRNIVYQFSADGSEFTLTYEERYLDWFEYKWRTKSYSYKLARFDDSLEQQFTAIYESSPGGTLGNYGRVVLREKDGVSDKLIKTSTVLAQIWGLGTADSDAGLGYDADRK